MSERDDKIARDLAKRCRAGDTTADLIDAISAALTTARSETWAKAIDVARQSAKKSQAANLSISAAEILISRIEQAARAAAKEGRE